MSQLGSDWTSQNARWVRSTDSDDPQPTVSTETRISPDTDQAFLRKVLPTGSQSARQARKNASCASSVRPEAQQSCAPSPDSKIATRANITHCLQHASTLRLAIVSNHRLAIAIARASCDAMHVMHVMCASARIFLHLLWFLAFSTLLAAIFGFLASRFTSRSTFRPGRSHLSRSMPIFCFEALPHGADPRSG